MEQRRRSLWRDLLREQFDPVTVVAILLIMLGALLFVAGYQPPSQLLQAIGAFVFGAGPSALVGAVTGRHAVRQQSAREANLTRKRETYGPLYRE